MDVCSAQQHVLLGKMFPQHLFLLSSFYLPLFNPSVPVLSVCACVCICEWWLRAKHLTLSKRKMMKTRVKSPTFIKVRPEMTNTQTTVDAATHVNSIALLLYRSTRKWHLTRVEMCFALNMQPFSYKPFPLTSRPPCCLSLTAICLWSQSIIICNRSVYCCFS